MPITSVKISEKKVEVEPIEIYHKFYLKANGIEKEAISRQALSLFGDKWLKKILKRGGVLK